MKKKKIWKDKTILGERRKNDYIQRHKNERESENEKFGEDKTTLDERRN